MQVIPAIDIRGGRCVRLVQGRFDAETVVAPDPVALARHWESLGAERIHVVDLDGAREGHPVNGDAVYAAVQAVSVPIQLGGGLRRLEDIQAALDAGVERAILGTSAVADPEMARAAFQRFGERVLLGLDARDGRVAVKGWLETADLDALEFAKQMRELGARRIVLTDIGRDGMLQGINDNQLRRFVAEAGLPIIASGGVSGLEDIRKARDAGAEAVIAGKALYAGALELPAAMEVARTRL